MALLDKANTETYGHPEITKVNIGVRNRPAILISGHDLKDINEFPISFDIAWYEQKAVAVLLALLSLGFKGIRLGPTLPAFLSPDVTRVLVENFDIKPIGKVEKDVREMMTTD
jgi:hydroxylamine reductase